MSTMLSPFSAAPEVPSIQGQAMSFYLEDGRLITVTFKMLTPSEAGELLKLNTRNRRLNSKSSGQIASDIADGEWKFTGDTIKIATDLNGIQFLADAQHRLEGIEKGGIPVPVLIVENLDPEVTDIIDQGRPRAVGDILRMAYGHSEIKNENSVAAIALLLMTGYGQCVKPTRKMVAEYCHANLDKLTAWASWATSINAETDKVQSGRSMVSAMTAAPIGALAAHMVANGGNYELVTEFFWRVASGLISDNDRTNVIPALRKRQKNGVPLARTGGGNATPELFTEFAVYINCYNKWVVGEKVSLVKSPKESVKSLLDLPPVSTFSR